MPNGSCSTLRKSFARTRDKHWVKHNAHRLSRPFGTTELGKADYRKGQRRGVDADLEKEMIGSIERLAQDTS